MRSLVTSLVLLTAAGCAASSSNEGSSANADIVAAPGQMALASSLPEYCSDPETIRIARPASSGDTKTFPYGFRYRAPSAPDAPVVVFLPGGIMEGVRRIMAMVRRGGTRAEGAMKPQAAE